VGYAVVSMGFAVGRENWLDKNWLELVRTGQAKPDSAPNCYAVRDGDIGFMSVK